MKRTRRALAAATALLLTAAPVSAATYGPPDTQNCVSHVSAVATGTVFGAGDCGKGIAVARREPGGAWRTTGAHWPAELRVEDVAADGVATFVVLSRGEGGRKTFYVGKQVHGSRTLSALTTLGSTEVGEDGASVVAAGGKWAVGWTETTLSSGRASSRIVVRGTVIGGLSRVIAAGESAPGEAALALGSADVHVLFTEAAEGTRVLRQSRVTVGGGHVATATRFAPAAGAGAALPEATWSGGTLVVAWSRAGRPAVALGGQRLDLPHRGSVTDLTVAASGGVAFVTTEEQFAFAGGSTVRVYARDVTRAGQRSVTELSAAAARSNPGVEVYLHSATAARGLSTVSTSAGIASQR